MKYLITESQNELVYFLRRLESPEMERHMRDIIDEEVDMISPCEWVDEETYLNDLLENSCITLLYNYIMQPQKMGESFNKLEQYVFDKMKPIFKKDILQYYNENIEDC